MPAAIAALTIVPHAHPRRGKSRAMVAGRCCAPAIWNAAKKEYALRETGFFPTMRSYLVEAGGVDSKQPHLGVRACEDAVAASIVFVPVVAGGSPHAAKASVHRELVIEFEVT